MSQKYTIGMKIYKLSHARIFSVLSLMPLENLFLVSLPFLASIARVIPTHLFKFLNILVRLLFIA